MDIESCLSLIVSFLDDRSRFMARSTSWLWMKCCSEKEYNDLTFMINENMEYKYEDTCLKYGLSGPNLLSLAECAMPGARKFSIPLGYKLRTIQMSPLIFEELTLHDTQEVHN